MWTVQYNDKCPTDEPNTPHFTSNPNSAYENSYTLTWETESYYPITEYRIMYRKAKVRRRKPKLVLGYLAY